EAARRRIACGEGEHDRDRQQRMCKITRTRIHEPLLWTEQRNQFGYPHSITPRGAREGAAGIAPRDRAPEAVSGTMIVRAAHFETPPLLIREQTLPEDRTPWQATPTR